jgi:hypothetical protein
MDTQSPDAPAETPRSAPAVMLQRLSGSLNALLACGVAQHAEDGVIELFLAAQEAAEGGMATIAMRVPIRCPSCQGTPSASCPGCGTTGTVEELFSAWLTVPPGITHGTVLNPSVLLSGMVQPVSFRVRLDVV